MAELVVSMGILVLMFALVGQIFSLTIQSSGQATALTEVGQLIRAFEQTLRDDLRGVHAGQSLILIQGNPINGYWSTIGQQSDDNNDPADGYPHAPDPIREDVNGNLIQPRADLLMFFTARKGASFINPRVRANLHQVVYGHAVLGDYQPLPTDSGVPPDFQFVPGPVAFPIDSLTGYPSPGAVSSVSADDWHLARRDILLVPAIAPPSIDPPLRLDDARLLVGQLDFIGNFKYEQRVLDLRFAFQSQVGNELLPLSWQLPAIFLPSFTGDMNYAPERTLLDTTPPAPRSSTLASYLLPRCSSFKVEWALDPHGEYVAGRLDLEQDLLWFDPGDPNGPLHALRQAIDEANALSQNTRESGLRSLLFGDDFHPDSSPNGVFPYSLSQRFENQSQALFGNPDAWPTLAVDQRSNLVVFGANRLRATTSATAPDETVEEDIYPVALRITLDIMDRAKRFERPQRHVIIAKVGG